jgi:hypothetical protein
MKRAPSLTLAVLVELQSLGVISTILFGGVIALLALGAGQRDDDASVFGLGWHD